MAAWERAHLPRQLCERILLVEQLLVRLSDVMLLILTGPEEA
ncbi:hypothetical protein ACIRYZ_44180 [Kitasatospora sp. NPDC101155]